MYRKSATHLTVNHLRTVYKVLRYRDSFKTVLFVKNHSISAERWDFCATNGINGEDSMGYQQSPGGFYGESQKGVEIQQKPDGFSQQWNPRVNTGEFRQNSNGTNGARTVGVQQNHATVFEENNFERHASSSSSQSGEINRNEFSWHPLGRDRNALTEYSPEGPRNGLLQHPVGQNRNFAGWVGELGRNSSGSSMDGGQTWQRTQNGIYGENLSGHNSYGFEREGQTEVKQTPIGSRGQSIPGSPGNIYGVDKESFGQSRSSANHHHSGTNIGSQQSLSNCYMGNIHTTQRSFDHWSDVNGVSPQSPSNYYVRNTGVPQQSPSSYFPGNAQMSWNDSGNCYTSNNRATGQNPTIYNGDTLGAPNGYAMVTSRMHQQASGWNNNGNAECYRLENSRMDQQIPGWNNKTNAESYQQNSYGTWNESNTKLDGGSVEAEESRTFVGTLEKLDNFCKEGKLKEAIEVLKLLEKQHIPVDLPRYFMLMEECGRAEALEESKYIHEHIKQSISAPGISTHNKILEMYGKCGSMEDAYLLFNNMPQRNLTSWDTMITWLARNGLGEEAIELFAKFKISGLEPDGQLFIGVFSACSILGDMTEGMLHFQSMSKDYSIVPSMEHYVSVVNMLGSTGYLEEALEFIEKMPVEPSVDVWETLMIFCRVFGNMELGDRSAELVEHMDPSRLSEEAKSGLILVKASDISKAKEKKKLAAETLLSVRSRVKEYRAGDRSHPENEKLYAQLIGLRQQMKEVGYVPETRFVLHDVDQESKEEALLAHSERLAVSDGLMSSAARQPIRIIKNLRVCGDCHNALKIMSKIVGRKFIIRDAKRFHHFEDGLCSCGDYW